MRDSTVCIESIGYELPKHVVTSAEIEARLAPLYDRLQLPYGRLEMMSGIRERRFWGDGGKPSDAPAPAGGKGRAPARGPRPEIEGIPHCSRSPGLLEPPTPPGLPPALKDSAQAPP